MATVQESCMASISQLPLLEFPYQMLNTILLSQCPGWCDCNLSKPHWCSGGTFHWHLQVQYHGRSLPNGHRWGWRLPGQLTVVRSLFFLSHFRWISIQYLYIDTTKCVCRIHSGILYTEINSLAYAQFSVHWDLVFQKKLGSEAAKSNKALASNSLKAIMQLDVTQQVSFCKWHEVPWTNQSTSLIPKWLIDLLDIWLTGRQYAKKW